MLKHPHKICSTRKTASGRSVTSSRTFLLKKQFEVRSRMVDNFQEPFEFSTSSCRSGIIPKKLSSATKSYHAQKNIKRTRNAHEQHEDAPPSPPEHMLCTPRMLTTPHTSIHPPAPGPALIRFYGGRNGQAHHTGGSFRVKAVAWPTIALHGRGHTTIS